MWEPVVRVSDTEQMGLSFFLREVDGQRVVGHTGTQANFRSFFWLNPATRTAVIGVVNTSGAGGNQAGPRFAAMMGEAIKVLSPES
jgi:CubicO group peptidase (beta-lactamase class C family)